MIQLYFYGFLLVSGVAVVLFLLYKKLYVDDDSYSFGGQEDIQHDPEIIEPAKREHAAYEDEQNSWLMNAIKRSPRTIGVIIVLQVATLFLSSYIGTMNAERIAMAGSSVAYGDYGTAVTSLFSMARPVVVENTRVARGYHPDLEKYGLHNFVYTGKTNNKNHAIMDNLYSTQDHDPDLKDGNPSYGNPIIGLSVGAAKGICGGYKIGEVEAKLLSVEVWDLNMSHFIAKRNIETHPNIPEWTRNRSEDDSDDFFVIAKESGVWEYALKEDIDREEGGYIDGDDLNIAGFRCEITW